MMKFINSDSHLVRLKKAASKTSCHGNIFKVQWMHIKNRKHKIIACKISEKLVKKLFRKTM